MKHGLFSILFCALLALGFWGSVSGKVGDNINGKGLRMGTPEEAALSKERLDRIGQTMRQHVAAGRIAGATGLIARRGRVGYFETYGMMDKEAGKPMRKDAIFRIYSMTKAVTGVATMILYEENKFALTDPVSKYLPEFAAMQVAVEGKDPATGKRTIRRRARRTRDHHPRSAAPYFGVGLSGAARREG